MSVRSGQSITKTFTTRVFATGVATDADSLPTGTLYVNGVADAASVTVTNITTGLYKAAVTLPTLAVGDVVDLRINATVSSVTDNAVIWTDTKDLATDANGKSPATIADGDIAADAINAASLKADAVTKIQNGLSTLNEAQVNAQCDAAISDAQLATSSAVSAMQLDVDDIKTITDQITFTVAGAVNVNVTSWLGFVVEVDAQNYPLIGTVNTRANYSLTSAYDPAKTAAQADTALSDLVWTNAKAAYLDAPVSSASAPTPAAVADAVCDELLADHMVAGSLARGIASAGAAGDPLSSPVPGSYTVGQAGYALALIGTGNTFAPIVGRIGATGEVVDSDTIVAYHFGPVEVNPLVVLDSNNDPVDMSVYSGNLAFIVFSVDETGVETNIVRLSGGNVVVGGDYNNEITLSGTTALTATVGRFRYALRVTTTNNKLVRLQGDFIVKACANTA